MKRGNLARITVLFFALILCFTILSRAAYQEGTAVVTLSRPENRVISHQVISTGKVVQNQELAVVTEPNQRVTAIYVKEGQRVKQGDLLFEIDLDLLEEKILEQQQEMEKQRLQVQDAKSQKDVSAMQKANEQAQAAENYSLNTKNAEVQLSRAKRNLENAKQELEDFRKNNGIIVSNSDVELALEAACQEKQTAYIQAQQELTELQWQIENAVNEEKNNALQGGTARNMDKNQAYEQAGLVTKDTVHTGSDEELIIEDGGSIIETEENTAVEPVETEQTGTQQPATEGNVSQDIILEDDSWEYTDPSQQDTETDSQNDTKLPSQEQLDQIENSVRSAWQSQLDAAQNKVDQALTEKEAAQVALEQYLQERLAASGTQNAQTEQQLMETVRAANDAYVDASLAANAAGITSGRAVASAGIPNASNSSDRMNEITYEQMELELEKLEELKSEEGKILAPADGLVTRINIITGEKTVDTTAILMADLSKGYRFVTDITKDQEKHIGRGDLVTLTSGNGKIKLEKLPVTSVMAAEENEDIYHVTIALSGDELEIGVAATMEFVKKSVTYATCVPISALHLDAKNQTYVLVTDEHQTVMGTELRARKVPVTVLEQNESYAALAEGGITSQQQVIINSDKAVDEGSRIRVEE